MPRPVQPKSTIASEESGKPPRAVRICFFSYNLYNLITGEQKGFGGAELDILNIASELAKDDAFHVTVVTVGKPSMPNARYEGMSLKVVLPPALEGSRAKPFRLLAITGFYGRLMAALISQKCDFYFTKLASPESYIVWIVSRMTRRKFVFRLGSTVETNMDLLKKELFAYAPRLAHIYEQMLKHTDVVIAQTSEQTAAVKANFGIAPTVIYNAHMLPSERAPLDRRTYALWVGRAHPLKQAHLFIDLARALPGYAFKMILSPAPGLEALFESLRIQAEQTANITFLPGVPQNEIIAHFQTAKVLIVTSSSEGLSNVLIEAFKTATPVVSLNINPDCLMRVQGPDDELIPAAGFSTLGNFDLLTAITERLLRDHHFLAQSSEAAYALAQKTFDLSSVIKQYKLILQE